MKKHTLIVSFMLLAIVAFSKEGVYLEFKVVSSGGGMSMTGTHKTYYTTGNTRTETTMKSNALPDPFSMITLSLENSPGKAYTLLEKDHTYTEADISGAAKNNEDCEITVNGHEKVNGYDCTHVTVVYKKTNHSSQMWVSKDVKGYAQFTTVKNDYLGGSKFFDALKKKNAEGFIVRMVLLTGDGGNMQMDLVKAEKRDLPDNLFSLNGYTRTGSGKVAPRPTERRLSMEELNKMTPEERQKYIDGLKAKNAQH